MEDEKIEAVKNWPEPKSGRDIQVFLGFANFYWQFISGFNKLAGPLTSMLRTANSLENFVTSVGVAEKDEMVGSSGFSRTNKNLSKSQKPKNSTSANAKTTQFLTSEASTTFIQLRQAFTKAPIFRHFDLECHIRIETNASGYAIGGVLGLLILDSGQWHPIAYFSREMIPAKTRYKTHDGELLPIVKAFNTWRHYLEGCKHEIFVLTDHNNLRRFLIQRV